MRQRLWIACLMLMLLAAGGCRNRYSAPAPETSAESGDYAAARQRLIEAAETARRRGDMIEERDLLTEYNRNYGDSESYRLREMDLNLALGLPERVVLFVDRLAPDEQSHDVLVRLGRAFEMMSDDNNAAAAYERALALEFRQDTLNRFMAARMRSTERALAPGFKEYMDEPWLTRDELAHLLVTEFEYYLPVSLRPPVIVDIDVADHQDDLLTAAAAGIIDVGRDHRIRPGARVRKLDLAVAFWQIMQFAGAIPDTSVLDNMALPADITRSHSAWDAVAHCYAAGILGMEPDGRFNSGKVPGGDDAVAAVDALSSFLSYHR